MSLDWAQVAAGALTGLVVGLTGVGGGALMTPLLLLVFGIAPVTAVGTDLWFAALTKLAAARIHHGRGLIEWEVVRRLWLGSLPASALTILSLRLGLIHLQQNRTLQMAIAGAVLLTAAGLLVQKPLLRLGTRAGMGDGSTAHGLQGPLTVLSGALLGFLVTLTSVGAGALGAVFLVFLYPRRLTPSRLVATDIAHAIPLALFAGLAHLLVGHVDLRLLATLLCGSVPGVILGTRLAARLPQAALKGTLALLLAATGLRLWIAAR